MAGRINQSGSTIRKFRTRIKSNESKAKNLLSIKNTNEARVITLRKRRTEHGMPGRKEAIT
jgi:hypothetical protein